MSKEIETRIAAALAGVRCDDLTRLWSPSWTQILAFANDMQLSAYRTLTSHAIELSEFLERWKSLQIS